jgi:hypothetical protein
MVSIFKDVLLFDNRVKLEGSSEIWLGQVEGEMKDTISKMISYAVTSFPKQSLDEWIIDYPQ